MTEPTPSYESAYQEIQQIVEDLEKLDLPLAELSTKVKRAVELIRYCQTKLRTIDDEIGDLFSQLNS
ncbi:MAG: exodeoxyribonuclease VII small subunit [Bacteroidota bacterium]